MKAYPLRFPEKAPKGTKQGAKLPEVSKQGREIGVFLAFSRVPSHIKRIDQDLRRRPLYPTELRGLISHFHAQGAVLPLGAKALSCQVAGTGRQSGGGTPPPAVALPLPDAMPDGRAKTDSIVLSIPGSVNRLFAPPRRPASRQSGSIPGARRAPLRRPAGNTRPAPLRGRECGSWPPTGPDCPNRD